jgi:hypothetical protein
MTAFYAPVLYEHKLTEKKKIINVAACFRKVMFSVFCSNSIVEVYGYTSLFSFLKGNDL